MKLTRRAFFQGLVASIATVAIAMRMAPKFLPDGLRGGTWRYEQATDKYFYGVDTAKPWEIQIFEQTNVHDPESWKLMDAKELMQRAYNELVETPTEIQVGPAPDWDKNRVRNELTDDSFVCGKDERWPWNNVKHVSQETIVEIGVTEGDEEAMEACSIIAMSQGFAALQVEGGPTLRHYDLKGTWDPDEALEVDILSVPVIHTNEAELFRHG